MYEFDQRDLLLFPASIGHNRASERALHRLSVSCIVSNRDRNSNNSIVGVCLRATVGVTNHKWICLYVARWLYWRVLVFDREFKLCSYCVLILIFFFNKTLKLHFCRRSIFHLTVSWPISLTSWYDAIPAVSVLDLYSCA